MVHYTREITSLLEHSFAELSLQDEIRKSKRMDLPDGALVVQFNMLAKEVMCKISASYECYRRDMIAFFGAPVVVIAKLWELILENNDWNEKRIKNKEHLLWALHYMKQAPNFSVLCKTLKKDSNKCPTRKTVSKWIWFYVNEISELEEKVIVWENRKTNDRGYDCLVSVDCIDCRFQQILVDHPTQEGKKIMNKALNSFKFRGPALRYEVAVSLLSNDIVRINGPFMPGDWQDITIFRHDLIHQLEPCERVEADDGYIGESPRFIVCPSSAATRAEQLALMKRVEGRHEVMNKHIKNWNCLSGKFEMKGPAMDKIEKHRILFYSCTIVKQVAMQMGVGQLYDI